MSDRSQMEASIFQWKFEELSAGHGDAVFEIKTEIVVLPYK